MVTKMIFVNVFLILCCLHLCSSSSYYDENACGIIANEFLPIDYDKKAMGGEDTKEGEYPFLVPIFFKNKYICTGTLISPRHVLTAAHCFSFGTPTFLQKRCGEDTVCLKQFLGKNAKEKCESGYLNEASIKKHYEIGYGSNSLNKLVNRAKIESIDPNYLQFFRSGCHQNDFAIITLAVDGNENKRSYVCFPYSFNLQKLNETILTSLGWGKDPIKNVPIHDILQKLPAGLLGSLKRCLTSWKPFPVDGICVDEKDDKDSCDGDSGGPLIAILPNQQQQPRYVMLGLLSFGTDCELLRQNAKPATAVYTRLDFYQQKMTEFFGLIKNENLDDLNFAGLS